MNNAVAYLNELAAGWERSLYAFLAEKERRSGSRQTMQSYSRTLQHFLAWRRGLPTPSRARRYSPGLTVPASPAGSPLRLPSAPRSPALMARSSLRRASMRGVSVEQAGLGCEGSTSRLSDRREELGDVLRRRQFVLAFLRLP